MGEADAAAPPMGGKAEQPQRAVQRKLASTVAHPIAILSGEGLEPSVSQLRDKVFLTLGILNTFVTLLILVRFPAVFWVWYTAWAMPLLAFRYVTYTQKKWQLFLVDNCYFVNALCFAHLFLAPTSHTLFALAFMSSCGPLAWAIVAWRNSLVFHDLERITSLFIHILPPLTMFAQRWKHELDPRGLPLPAYLTCDGSATQPAATTAVCSVGMMHHLVLPVCFYVIWQAIYWIKTEVVDRKKLEDDPEIQTSLRWLAGSGKGIMHDAALAASRALGCMGRTERFNPSSLKTKVVFMSAQLVYTIVTLLPTILMYRNVYVHAAFLAVWSLAAAFNGSSFYVDVYSRGTTYVSPTSGSEGASADGGAGKKGEPAEAKKDKARAD